MGSAASTSSTSKHGIIVLGAPTTAAGKEGFEELAKEHNVVFVQGTTRGEAITSLKKLASKGNYDAVVIMWGGPWGAIDKELLGPLQGKLKFVGGMGAGFDNVDTSWLDEIGAWYANGPNSVADPTATQSVLLMLQCIRHTAEIEAAVRKGEWRAAVKPMYDVQGLVVGLIGMGTIGKLVRNKIQALGMRVIYYNRNRLPPEEEGGATYVTFEELLKQSQLISLHCPLTEQTHHLLSTKEFEMMNKGVMIVNTSRGKVIDEEALVAALKSGQVDRAGLDVFENEPKIQPYLLSSERCSLSPHYGASTMNTSTNAEKELVENIRQWIKTGKPNTGVNHPVGQAGSKAPILDGDETALMKGAEVPVSARETSTPKAFQLSTQYEPDLII